MSILLPQSMERQSLRTAPYFTEHCSYLGGAYLCKAKTAEFELESYVLQVRFDADQALSEYLFVTFERYFVTVGPVVI